jgi:hypothetical protein
MFFLALTHVLFLLLFYSNHDVGPTICYYLISFIVLLAVSHSHRLCLAMCFVNFRVNSTNTPGDYSLWPSNVCGPIPRVKFLDLPPCVRQHIYEFLPQTGHSMHLVGPVCGYSGKIVSFFLDQYLSDPRHHWPGSEDDYIVMFIDYPPHILAHLQRKKYLCVSEHQVHRYLWFHHMQLELKFMLGRTLEYDPVLFVVPELVFPT